MNILIIAQIFIIEPAILPDKCVVGGKIALTFDDGPTAATPEILELLSDKKVPATFHFVTQNISRPNIQAIINETIENEHEVGLRVNPQRNYDDMDPDEIREDIENQIAALATVMGSKEDIKYARAPIEDGITNPYVYEVLKDQDLIQTGYSHCMYHEVDDVDQLEKALNLLFTASNKNYDSFIFLLHEQKELEFPTVETIIEVGEKYGYEFVTLNECLKGYEPGQIITRSGVKSNRKQSSSPELIIKGISNLALLLLNC